MFPPHQQKQIRLQLASVLRAVVSQRLMPRAGGKGRVPAVEVLTTTAFIRDCIVDKEKTHLIHGAIAQGTSQYGMQTFDQSIFSLYEQGLVALEEALRWASNVDDFKLKVQGISTTADLARDQMAATGYTGQARDHEVWLTRLPERPAPARPPRAVRSAAAHPPVAPRRIPDDEIDDAVARLAAGRRPRRRPHRPAPSPAPQLALKKRGPRRVRREIEAAGIAADARRTRGGGGLDDVDADAPRVASTAARTRGCGRAPRADRRSPWPRACTGRLVAARPRAGGSSRRAI